MQRFHPVWCTACVICLAVSFVVVAACTDYV